MKFNATQLKTVLIAALKYFWNVEILRSIAAIVFGQMPTIEKDAEGTEFYCFDPIPSWLNLILQEAVDTLREKELLK